ncbi:Hsp70 family protein [Amycolatopsis nigrescens]|uniref:Hsp70 family protein n=1 Tax=Amycolatopsis nigrescens TaxID=381445 RepID=UPI00037A3FB4|nr:Hsp70 family protein [Amycolatopsis nigrescens]
MVRETTDFGIDLGTTNSAIAMATADDATVIRNNLQAEYTPSAVYISRSQKILVGAPAKDRVEEDPDNACAEFKLQMGVVGEHKLFEVAGRSMTPEELSAEVLKSLRGDVQQASGESIHAAVITVPAAFELDQCDATRKAAVLAGLDFAPLIQEPSAAAWAYSTRLGHDRGFWLVYDFGGGTFDAAVVKVADGEFSTVNHAGDNFLGGKLIDWALVEDVLVPAARKEFNLPELARGHRRSAGNLAKLKAAAESAKIQLSRVDSVDIQLTLNDCADGKPEFDFEYELTRADVERAALPLYRRSISLCHKALADSGLGPADIERVLLVGGTTIAPALRELLADPAEGLGIALDHSLDPVTVVARGAAIFAGTQRMPHRVERTEQALSQGRVVLDLQYKTAGSDVEPLVGGLPPRTAQPQDWTGATIEFVNPDGKPAWRSGRIPLTAEGTFAARLHADERTTNNYTIELRDAKGTLLPTEPDLIPYRHTPIIGTAPTLSHSIGVGLDNNEVEWLVRKGTELPAKKRLILRSTVHVRRNERTGMIRVPIVEGERPKADRNMLIGRLDIAPAEVGRDVPAGSEVEVHLRIDTSFAPRADAYVPLLDEEFPIQVELGRTGPADGADLGAAVDDLADRFAELADRTDQVRSGAVEAVELIDRFRADEVLAGIRQLADAAEVDPDAASTCERQLRDAQTTLDEVEAALLFPELVDEAYTVLDGVRGLVNESGSAARRNDLRNAERTMESAITAGDRTVLQRQIGVLRDIFREVLQETGQLDTVIFMARERGLTGNPDPRVQRLLREGRTALDRGDGAQLNSINNQLEKIAPDDVEIADISGPFGSTVTVGDR